MGDASVMRDTDVDDERRRVANTVMKDLEKKYVEVLRRQEGCAER